MKIKKLTSTIALTLGLLGAGLSAQEMPKNLGIPERFEDYRTKGKLLHVENIYGYVLNNPIYNNSQLYVVQPYSLNEKGSADVQEFYKVLQSNENDSFLLTEKNPLFYNFDLNNNGSFEPEEILMDKARGGLNGNEEWAWKKI